MSSPRTPIFLHSEQFPDLVAPAEPQSTANRLKARAKTLLDRYHELQAAGDADTRRVWMTDAANLLDELRVTL